MPKCNACFNKEIDFPRQMICSDCITKMIEEFDVWAEKIGQPTSKNVPMFIDAQKDEQTPQKA